MLQLLLFACLVCGENGPSGADSVGGVQSSNPGFYMCSNHSGQAEGAVHLILTCRSEINGKDCALELPVCLSGFSQHLQWTACAVGIPG